MGWFSQSKEENEEIRGIRDTDMKRKTNEQIIMISLDKETKKDNTTEFYRYEEVLTAFNGVTVILKKYKLVKETKKGYWISPKHWELSKRWVSKNGKRRFAYPTKEEAERNFIARKKCQIQILESNLRVARKALEIIIGSKG